MVATKFIFLLVALVFAFSPNSLVGAENVSLNLYYETLCSYCSRFFVNYLGKMFSNGLTDIVDRRLIPYSHLSMDMISQLSLSHMTL
ncbi:hypothetical protein AMTRI_Chr05g61080 [Amborella trichopoda]